MTKNEAPVELLPDAFIAEAQGVPKPVKQRAERAVKAASASADDSVAAAPWKTRAVEPTRAPIKPILVGVGIGAAVAVAALSLNANKGARKGSVRAPQSTVTKLLAKAALLAVGRIVAKRAARALAQRAVAAVAARAATRVANRFIGPSHAA